MKIIENPICNEANDVRDFIQVVNPKEHLSYQMPEKPFEIFEEDFIKTLMDYEMFKQGIDDKEFGNILLQKTMYSSHVESDDFPTAKDIGIAKNY